MRRLRLHLVLVIALARPQTSVALGFDQFQRLVAPKDFMQSELFRIPASCAQPVFSYSDPKYGTFSFAGEGQVVRENDGYRIQFFPSTYQRKLSWSVTCGGQTLKLKTVSYPSPAPELNRYVVRAEGGCSFPFVMGNAWVDDGPLKGSSFPVAWNVDGEAIWAYSSAHEPILDHDNVVMVRQLANYEWIFLSYKDHSEFTRMKATGDFVKKFDFREAGLRENSQAFHFDLEHNLLRYFAPTCQPDREAPNGLKYSARRLVEVNLTDMTSHTLWNSYEQFPPLRYPNLFMGPMNLFDPFLDIHDPISRKEMREANRFTVNWGSETCDTEWSHENAVDHNDERGFLISSRNLNKLTIFDPKTKKTQVIGTKPGCDLCLEKDVAFSIQHAAQFLDRDHLLIFDNHLPYRGGIGNRWTSYLLLLKLEGVPAKSVRIEERVAIPGVQPLARGYVGPLKNGNWFVYNPGNVGTVESLLEYSPVAKRYLCRVDWANLGFDRAIEARGFASFMGETFTAFTKPPNPLTPSALMDLRAFTY